MEANDILYQEVMRDITSDEFDRSLPYPKFEQLVKPTIDKIKRLPKSMQQNLYEDPERLVL